MDRGAAQTGITRKRLFFVDAPRADPSFAIRRLVEAKLGPRTVVIAGTKLSTNPHVALALGEVGVVEVVRKKGAGNPAAGQFFLPASACRAHATVLLALRSVFAHFDAKTPAVFR